MWLTCDPFLQCKGIYKCMAINIFEGFIIISIKKDDEDL